VVVEVKTDLVDVQSLLGSLDAKARLATHVATRFGWQVRAVVPAIVFVENRMVRDRLHRLETLFDRFTVRGRSAITWLRRPVDPPSGLLWFAAMPATQKADVIGRRVYQRKRGARARAS
jgi:hypothetical protein